MKTLRKGTGDVKSIEIVNDSVMNTSVIAEVFCDGLTEAHAPLDLIDLKAINCCIENFNLIHDSL